MGGEGPQRPGSALRARSGVSTAFDGWYFDERDRLIYLDLHYSSYFKDGAPEARAKIERVIERKTGLAGDYMYEWDEEGNRLSVAIVPRPGSTGAPMELPEAPATGSGAAGR